MLKTVIFIALMTIFSPAMAEWKYDGRRIVYHESPEIGLDIICEENGTWNVLITDRASLVDEDRWFLLSIDSVSHDVYVNREGMFKLTDMSYSPKDASQLINRLRQGWNLSVFSYASKRNLVEHKSVTVHKIDLSGVIKETNKLKCAVS